MTLYIFLSSVSLEELYLSPNKRTYQAALDSMVKQLGPAKTVIRQAITNKRRVCIVVDQPEQQKIGRGNLLFQLGISPTRDNTECLQLKYPNELLDVLSRKRTRPIVINLSTQGLAEQTRQLLGLFDPIIIDTTPTNQPSSDIANPSNTANDWQRKALTALTCPPMPDFLSATKHGQKKPFTSVTQIVSSEKNKFNHLVYNARKFNEVQSLNKQPTKYQTHHYLKAGLPLNILPEVIGQEFLRLWLPNQPKTRVVVMNDNQTAFVRSKAVNATCSLSDKNKNNPSFKANLLTSNNNLGKVLICLRHLRSRDAKLAHFLIKERQFKDKQFISIDGGEHFWFNPNDYKFTIDDINALPDVFPENFSPWNWLDIYYEDEKQPFPSFFNPVFSQQLKSATHFQQSINEGILIILLTTDRMIERMINYIGFEDESFHRLIEREVMLHFNMDPENIGTSWSANDPDINKKIIANKINKYVEFMLIMRDQLLEAIHKDQKFIHYLHSSAATVALQKQIDYLETFTLSGKEKLMTPEMLNEVREVFNILQEEYKLIAVSIDEEDTTSEESDSPTRSLKN